MNTSAKQIQIHRAEDRAYFELSWLKSAYSFTYSSYYNPQKMGFGTLRVVNEEVVSPGTGFFEHEHKNMEVLTFPLRGELKMVRENRKPVLVGENEVHCLSSGTGVLHAEQNASKEEELEFMQFYISPNQKETKPSVGLKHFKPDNALNTLQLIASPNGADRSLTLKQDAFVYRSILEEGKSIAFTSEDADYFQYLQLIEGEISIEGETLTSRDAIAIKKGNELLIKANTQSTFILFDLPAKAVR